ncbi:hypothetical protein L0F63_005486 [Massospora cicadina]|nr:hypothetical protein L0F63_005486 [Massospora cicadina]
MRPLICHIESRSHAHIDKAPLIDGAAQMQAVLRDEELLFHTFFTEGEAELAIHLDELLALFYELWSNNFAKRLKDRTAPLQSSAAEATAFLRSQVRILESTNFSKAGQKVASILATVELRQRSATGGPRSRSGLRKVKNWTAVHQLPAVALGA